jgi:hypothetical protein
MYSTLQLGVRRCLLRLQLGKKGSEALGIIQGLQNSNARVFKRIMDLFNESNAGGPAPAPAPPAAEEKKVAPAAKSRENKSREQEAASAAEDDGAPAKAVSLVLVAAGEVCPKFLCMPGFKAGACQAHGHEASSA